MNRAALRLILAAAISSILVAPALAQPVAYRFDKSHSVVGFNIRHFFAKVPGRFADYDGKLLIDPKNLSASTVDVTIQATSIDTDNERRDTDLRGENFFDVQKFPTLTFKSTKVVPGEGTAFKIEGDLTIRGVTKPVVLNVENLGMGTVAMNGRSMGTRAGFEATTKIDRKDYGIVWNRALDQGGAMLGDDVWITLQIEAVKDEPKPENASAKPAEGAKAQAEAKVQSEGKAAENKSEDKK